MPRCASCPASARTWRSAFARLPTTGDTPFRQELLAAFPPTLLDLLRLQGVGPKTVKRLYDELGVASLDTLEAACKDGRVRALKGMGDKKEALILKAIEERKPLRRTAPGGPGRRRPRARSSLA